jgi:hypothetical protein
MLFATHHRSRVLLVTFASLTVAACSEVSGPAPKPAESSAAEARVVGSGLSLALVGPKVAKYTAKAWARERERIVLRGEKTAAGDCYYRYRYRVAASEQPLAAWAVYHDPASCTYIMARGDYDHALRARMLSAQLARVGAKDLAHTYNSEMSASASAGTIQGGEALTTGSSTMRYIYDRNGFVAASDLITVQHRYTLSPDCVTHATAVHFGNWNGDEGLGYNISNNLFYFDLGLEHTCAKFGFGSGSFYDVENGPRCNNANGMFIRFGPNNVFLEFMQGGLWRYYEADWADNFWQKCPNASSDFSPEWFGDPHSGLIS